MSLRPFLIATSISFAALSCGGAEIVAPERLVVVDTHPGNGSTVEPGVVPIVILFSEEIDQATLGAAIRLEEASPAGGILRELTLALRSYDVGTHTAVYSVESLESGRGFILTVRSEGVRAASGARLFGDLVRRFRTR